jgi:DUF1365 family protein
MFMIDLDELTKLNPSSKLIGVNRLNLYSFYDADHFEGTGVKTDSAPSKELSVKEKVISFVRERAPAEIIERVTLLTNLRFMGYVFNPISVFYCYGAANQLACAVVEVGNTFKERKLYFVPGSARNEATGGLTSRQKKLFYVSPFIDLTANFLFDLSVPGEKLRLSVDSQRDGNLSPDLRATICGDRLPFSSWNMLKMTLKYPFVTVSIIAGIHLHALFIWLKKTPFIRKESNLNLQVDVLNPHVSLQPPQVFGTHLKAEPILQPNVQRYAEGDTP